jgi:hypothetical protein
MRTIRDVLLDFNIPHAGAEHKHGRPGWVQVDCPWCGSVGKYHLGINLNTGAAACWVCGKKNTAKVLDAIGGMGIARARAAIDGAALEAVPERPQGRLALPLGRGAMGPAHEAYLRKRGLDPDTLATLWGLEGLGATGRRAPRPDDDEVRWLKWRIFIPIHLNGHIVSWTTRAIGKGQRYLSAAAEEEDVPHKSILFGGDHARHGITIHEGPLDAMAVGPGAVATCGTGFNDAQVLLMARYPVRAVCFDNVPDAQRRARELADMLAPYPGTTHNVVLETGKDAADADKEEIAELRAAFLD